MTFSSFKQIYLLNHLAFYYYLLFNLQISVIWHLGKSPSLFHLHTAKVNAECWVFHRSESTSFITENLLLVFLAIVYLSIVMLVLLYISMLNVKRKASQA